MNLEQCVYNLQVMRLNYVPSNMERCRNCTEYSMLQCDRYKPYNSSFQIPITHGRLAIDFMKRFYRDNISIEGLPHEAE